MSLDHKLSARVHLPELTPSSDHSWRDEQPLPFNELIAPHLTELEDARDRYDQATERLRRWRWWFVGMFTFYTTLVGILLLTILGR